VSRLGPGDASLEVHTYREGAAARVGHDLVLEVTRWEATVEDGRIELTADPRSLEVREGRGGVKPLSDGDRREILKNIDAKVLRGQPIEFRSTRVEDGLVEGELTMGGATRPISARLGPDRRGIVTLRQSDWGIKPYRGLMGALKVRDEVEVVIS
jgi:polyisoprenoid-binding protein YceI